MLYHDPHRPNRGGNIEDQVQNPAGVRLRLHAVLARFLGLWSYRAKIYLAVFTGVHVPLISLVIYAAFGFPGWVWGSRTLTMLIIALAATLIGTATTIYVLNALLKPVSVISRALREYVEEGTIPEVPSGGGQEGRILSDLNYTMEQVRRLDRTVSVPGELSFHDHLTGVYNRRGCENRLEEDLARVRRGGGSLTLAVLDVDHLKRINDAYGHQAGDVCLRHVARVIEDNIRRGDWLARWGGDEFVVVLWDANSTVEPILDHITGALHNNLARPPGAPAIRLTLSGGVSRCSSEQDVQKCFGTADEALRRAKQQGRSRIVYDV